MKTALLTAFATALFAVPPGDAEEVNFALLSNYDYKEGMTLPKSVTKFDQKKVKVGGFMATEDGSEGDVQYFILVNDACGCSGRPKLNEMIFCTMPEGQKARIKPGTATVTGTLYVAETKEDGVVVSLYTMDVESVQ